MRIGLVCGDGLPVSGLLTIFRNVVGLAEDLTVIDTPVPTDLGFAWRPDKPAFFPDGSPSIAFPAWMDLVDPYVPAAYRERLGEDLGRVRAAVADLDALSTVERAEIGIIYEELKDFYQSHFDWWLQTIDVDWVFAINMTLSDAVPVTAALHAAASAHYGRRRSGGVVWWDHDLFGSYAVRDRATQGLTYPMEPNELTPIPGNSPYTRWIVVSEALAEEASRYETDLIPTVVPNALPVLAARNIGDRHRQFLRDNALDPSRPFLLCPVRVFHVKGVELSIQLASAFKSAAERRGDPMPYLLIFGSLQEEPDYAREVVDRAKTLGVSDDVRFLDGVPLSSAVDSTGRWRLDELDLFSLAASTRGGVIFTPNVVDVESIGLGPGLASMAELPFIVTAYDAFRPVYGSSLAHTYLAGSTVAELLVAAEEFLDVLDRSRMHDPALSAILQSNRVIVEGRFPREAWARLLRQLSSETRDPISSI